MVYTHDKIKLPQLMDHIRTLPKIQQRKISAILGACVADAASRPLHWVYDMSAMKTYLNVDKLEGGSAIKWSDEPEFYAENKSPFYFIIIPLNF